MSEKAFGKLTLDQLRRLIRRVPEIRSAGDSLQQALRAASEEDVRGLLATGGSWADVYELTFAEHTALVVHALGLKDYVLKIAAAPDPQEEALRPIRDDSFDNWAGGEGGLFTRGDVAFLTLTLQRTILSVLVFQRSLSALVEEVREGSDKALFDVVRIDRSAVACPTIATRIATAELLGEKKFFDHLRNALKGPRQKHWESYRDLRYSLAVLREMGLNDLSDTQLEQLLVTDLKVYPNTPAARKNLRKHYYESRKLRSL